MGGLVALLRTLGPIAAVLIGLGGGGALSGAAFWAWNTLIDNPQLIAITKATADAECRIRVLEAADAAEKAERARQDAASQAAIEAYLDEAAEREKLAADERDRLEQEIADYEQQLAAGRRQCLTDHADVQFLRGTK